MEEISGKKSFSELRRRAQSIIGAKPGSVAIPATDVGNLIHELDTYQIELELQNEELRQAQVRLEESQQRYVNLYDFAPIAYLTVSDKGMIVEANLTAAKMLGVHRGQLINRLLSGFIAPVDKNIFYLNRKKMLETQQKQSYELRLQKQEGHLFHAQVEAVVNPAECDRPGQFRITISDISQRKEMEAVVQQIKDKYRAIVMDQQDLICRFDSQGRITFVNDAYCRCFGVKHREILGSNFLPNIHKDDLPLIRDHFKDLTQLVPDKTIEHRVYMPNGELRWQQWCGRAFYDKEGEILECQAVGRDITPLKEAEEKLQKAHNELEQRVQERTVELQKSYKQLLHAEKLSAVGNLSASIAHEFNNPLQSIMTIIQGLGDYATLDVQEKKLVSLAIQECHRLKKLIGNLRDFYQPSSGQLTPVDLHATLDALLSINKKDFSTRHIKVVKKYADNIPSIMAVNDQLKQVFLNLFNNAADACEGGGLITCTTERLGGDIVAHIADTGVGIAPENIPHIFEPFFTTKPEMKGTGLGLSVSYGIIHNHGGTIHVRSEPGQGSIFSVVLPVKGVNNE